MIGITAISARPIRALRLNWDTDVDLDHRTLSLGRTKIDELRTAHIPDTLYDELAAHAHRPLRNACRRPVCPISARTSWAATPMRPG